MATNFWICYSTGCLYKGPTKEFEHKEGGHICPKCESEDVFPWRKFRCLGCGHADEQPKFFAFKLHGREEESDIDPDPFVDKWPYECSAVNNQDCDSTSYEQIDESDEPPKQKLYWLHRRMVAGVLMFIHQESGRAALEISFGQSPIGTRFVLKRRYGDDAQATSQVVGTHAPIEAFMGDRVLFGDDAQAIDRKRAYGYSIKASNPAYNEDDDFFVYIPTQAYGDRKDWTVDQWFESMTKTEAETVRSAKEEEQTIRDLDEIEKLFGGDQRRTDEFVVRYGHYPSSDILKLAKREVLENKKKAETPKRSKAK